MTSLSFLPKFNKITEEEKTINQNTPKKNKINFNDFNSALFMSEYQENEENSSENENKENKIKLSNSNKQKEKEKNFNYNDFKFKYSFDNCLTNELVDTLDKGSNETKKKEKLFKDDLLDKNSSEDFLKISKTLLPQTDTSTKKKYDENNVIKNKNKNIVYQVNINDFEYQLKFIENSVHNILPQSYKKNNKKSFYNNNNYSYNKSNHRTSFPYSNKYRSNNNYNYNKNENEKYFYSNDKPSFAKIHYPNLINKNNEGNDQNNFFPDNKNVKNQILFQIQKVKANENDYDDWKCNNCEFLNRGYRKVCAKCNIYRQK